MRVRPLEDGMAELSAVHTADAITAAYAAINHAAQGGSATADNDGASEVDDRIADQRRADALIDLLTCAGPADANETAQGACSVRKPCGCGRRPAVLVTVAASTLLGLAAQPGELAGYGPIPAALARAIAADPTGTWRRLVTDPIGRLLDYGRTTYRPPAALADHVRGRDWTCRFPPCNRRAEACELDHALAWEQGGETSAANMQLLCPRHHHAKHEAGWRSVRHSDGSIEWTSRTGRRYRKQGETLPIDGTSEARWLDDDTGPPG